MFEYLKFLQILNIRDIVEILCFTSVIYYFSIWLKQDSQKKLLPSFYFFCFSIIATYLLQMNTLCNFLISFWPVIIMLFILVHQNILQKNFITLKNITPTKNNNSDWLEIFFRSCLIAMNDNKKITAIIEGNDALEGFLNSSYKMQMQTPISQELLDVMINSPSYDSNKMIWIKCNGNLQAINTFLDLKNHNIWKSDEIQNLEEWKQDALIFTSRNDSLIFRIYPEKNCFDLIINGKLSENIPSNNAIKMIQQFVKKNSIQIKKGQDNNENNIKTKSSSNQPFA